MNHSINITGIIIIENGEYHKEIQKTYRNSFRLSKLLFYLFILSKIVHLLFKKGNNRLVLYWFNVCLEVNFNFKITF